MELTFLEVRTDDSPVLLNAAEISYIRRGYGCTMIFLRSGSVVESCEDYDEITKKISKLTGGRS